MNAREQLRGMEGELNRNLKLEEAVTDERVGLFTPDKDGYTHTSRGRVAVLASPFMITMSNSTHPLAACIVEYE